jgi:signal peptidase II
MKNRILGIILMMIMCAADQLSKMLMMEKLLNPVRHIDVLPFLKFVPAWNRGISFSLLSTMGPSILSIGISVLILVFIYWWIKTTDKLGQVGLSMIIGGALGNLIDRFRFEAVFDFIYFFYQEYAFPAFNLADSAITLGAGLYLLHLIKDHQRSLKS